MLEKIGITIPNLFWYFVWIIVSDLIIRAIMNMFKTAAIRQGELGEKGKKFQEKGRCELFWILYRNRGQDRLIDDYWLPTILGTFELLAYPIFIVKGEWLLIGAWIGIKTAPRWGRWTEPETRAPYMRFLVGNALVILASFFLTQFVYVIPK